MNSTFKFDTTETFFRFSGAKKRKTTIPTTRHISHSPQLSSPSLTISKTNESNSYRSSELPLNHQSTNQNNLMSVVGNVEDEQPIHQFDQSDMNTSLIIVESNECDDGKIHLDDTLPSCSSGYESAAPLTNIDVNTEHYPSSDDDDDDEIRRSRKHSSSCQSERSPLPILSTVSTNVTIHKEKQHDSSPVTTTKQKSNIRLRDKYGKFCARSRSPTPRTVKKQCSYHETNLSTNTITSDRIEQHLRTLSMSKNEQRRTRTRPIKTPTRLVEEIASNYSIDESSNASTTNDTTFKSNSTEPLCTYNVTISNKPNKLGLTIKKVLQR